MIFWLKLILIIGIIISSMVIIGNVSYYKKLKEKDRIFNTILAVFIDGAFIYFLISDRWCYTCSVYNNYILYLGFVIVVGWMLYDLIKEILGLNKHES